MNAALLAGITDLASGIVQGFAAGPITRQGPVNPHELFTFPKNKNLRVWETRYKMAGISTSGPVAAALLKKSPFVDFSQKTVAIIELWQ
ncbi:hypothetical protein [Ensifer aridi]|uniref:hypothetical protein n=1 Tax=Ensifer aridi TaxID=1708715 RepID=UPI000A10D5B0|nr:hypothetical protein [Ensifer aridi]